MKSAERNVSDMAIDDRRVFERVLGEPLRENERVLIQVSGIDEVKTNGSDSSNGTGAANLDDWAIFADLSDQEIAELEAAILDRSLSREIDI